MRQRPTTASAIAQPVFPAVHPGQPIGLFEGDSDSDTDQLAPAVLISPVKARAAKRGIASKNDVAVWDLPDHEIIGE